MNKDEALKMAIEALQNNQTYDWKGNPLTALEEANEKVINACKEALKEDALDRMADNARELGLIYESQNQEYDINEMIDKITPENLQEPVAYADYERGTCYLIGTPIPKDEIANPLYTHPAQPLSDDEIQKTWYNLYPLDENNLWTDMLEGEHLRKFARAIEKAHGIGVKDDTLEG
jgi:hypothetical protein